MLRQTKFVEGMGVVTHGSDRFEEVAYLLKVWGESEVLQELRGELIFRGTQPTYAEFNRTQSVEVHLFSGEILQGQATVHHSGTSLVFECIRVLQQRY